MRTIGRMECAAVLVGLALLAGCGGSGDPAPDAGPVSTPGEDEPDDGPRLPPALERGDRSPEAGMVSVLERAKLVRVLRLDPDSPDCATSNCILGNAVTAGVVVTEEHAAWEAKDLVNAWLAQAESVEPTCDPHLGHAVVLQGGGHEYTLMVDTRCGAYQLVEDGRALSRGQVVPPKQIGTLEALLLAGEVNDGLVEGNDAADGDAGTDEATDAEDTTADPGEAPGDSTEPAEPTTDA
jgi:hypothetical protein